MLGELSTLLVAISHHPVQASTLVVVCFAIASIIELFKD